MNTHDYQERKAEILYNLIMLDKVREASEVETDEQFIAAAQALDALFLEVVEDATKDSYPHGRRVRDTLRAELRSVIGGEKNV